MNTTDPDSPEGLRAAERRYIDAHPLVISARAAVREVTARSLAVLFDGAAELHCLDGIAAELTLALETVGVVEDEARACWRGHLALGFD